MRLFVWLFRAFVFFCLFAFALNNQQSASVHWFFGHAWSAPLVIIVLVAFAGGAAVGVLAMMPLWWRQRQHTRQPVPASPVPPATTAASAADPVIPDGI